MTNEEKARIISGRTFGFQNGKTQEIFDACMEMAKWKDKKFAEQNKWHKVTDGDLPQETDKEYLCIRKGKFLLSDDLSYDILYFSEDKRFESYCDSSVISMNNIIAWCELPKYENE